MRSLWSRLSLCCLLALSLPLQSIGAAAMSVCGSRFVSAPVTTTMAGVEALVHGGTHSSHSGGHSMSHMMAHPTSPSLSDEHGAAPASGLHPASDGSDDADMPAAAHQCSYCAACNVGAVLIDNPGPDLFGLRPVDAPWAKPPVTCVEFLSEGLERPPRRSIV